MKKLLIADFYPAALGGLVAMAAAIVLRTLIGTRLLAELVLDGTLGILPGESFSTLLGVFGPYGKALFFASTLLGILAFYVVIWARSRTSPCSPRPCTSASSGNRSPPRRDNKR